MIDYRIGENGSNPNSYTRNGIWYVNVTRIPDEEVKIKRGDFKTFKTVMNIKGETFKKEGHQIHHIIPLSLGGDNFAYNRINMLPEEHTLFHYYIITPQTSDMTIGETRRIMLPLMLDKEVFYLSSKDFRAFLAKFEKRVKIDKTFYTRMKEIQKTYKQKYGISIDRTNFR